MRYEVQRHRNCLFVIDTQTGRKVESADFNEQAEIRAVCEKLNKEGKEK